MMPITKPWKQPWKNCQSDNDRHRLVRTGQLPNPWFPMTKSSVLRFSKYGVFQERGIYRRKIREKRGVFTERKSIAKTKKARKCWAFEAMPFLAYESSFVVNGGDDRIRTCEELPPTRFPGVRLKPLGHISVVRAKPYEGASTLEPWFSKIKRVNINSSVI